jgi:hypothetical protein
MIWRQMPSEWLKEGSSSGKESYASKFSNLWRLLSGIEETKKTYHHNLCKANRIKARRGPATLETTGDNLSHQDVESLIKNQRVKSKSS